MSDIKTIKDSLKTRFTVFSKEPVYHEEQPQCKVSVGVLDVGVRVSKPFTRVEIWTLSDPDDIALVDAIADVTEFLCDDIGAIAVEGEPLPAHEISGGTWSGYAVNVRIR